MSADPTAPAGPDLAQLQGMLAVSQRNLEMSDRGRLEEAAKRYEVEQQLAAAQVANGTLRDAHQRLETERNETAERGVAVATENHRLVAEMEQIQARTAALETGLGAARDSRQRRQGELPP